ncbi:hypothetical protein BC938DRAFT_478952 [Jimgerdemannia flammicorona]|uniref:Methyltransferase domain-containing protein n=1 Tax=Jimgerdemannia flammicorona TaxID=994334 RepID=A0A433QLY7_9FUNG|nr:hypothetical protein BC938DRAFT_478952 [Jimgerdemannia flammicorona]
MGQLNTKFNVRKPTKSDDEDSVPPPPPVGAPPGFIWMDGRGGGRLALDAVWHHRVWTKDSNLLLTFFSPHAAFQIFISEGLNSINDRDRLFIFHIFNRSFNSPMTEELKKGIKVLDVGCGTGVWCVVGLQYASTTGMATRLEYVLRQYRASSQRDPEKESTAGG